MSLYHIFKPDGLEKLGFEYLPPTLPHRESQINDLLNALEPLIRGSPSSVISPILHGPTGTGKTSTLRKVMSLIKEKTISRNLRLRTLLVNCSVSGRTFAITQRICETIAELPTRGYSDFEMLHRAYSELEIRDEYLLLGLDDLDGLIRREGARILLLLSRIEESENLTRRIIPILVLRDINTLQMLDKSLLSKISGIRIEFPPYTENEIKTIIEQRVELAFQPEVVSKESIRQISFNASFFGGGDARYAITLLQRSGFIAANENSRKINVEHVRKAQYQIENLFPVRLTEKVSKRDIIALVAICEYFRSNPNAYFADLDECLKIYLDLSRKIFEKILTNEDFKKSLSRLIAEGALLKRQGIILPHMPADLLYKRLVNYLFRGM